MTQKRFRSISRRRVLQGAAAGSLAAAAPAVFRPAFAVPETVKIGLVGPRTGPLALFYEEMGWAIDAVKKFTGKAADCCEVQPLGCGQIILREAAIFSAAAPSCA